MAISSRLTFSAAAARAAATDDDDLDEEPGEVIESAPPLKVGEEREIFGGSGLRKRLIKAGRGWESPVFGDEVTVHYVSRLLNGTEFDSTRDKGEPVTLKLGQGEVVSGLDQGIVTMKKGECSLFTLPPSLGYGQVSIGDVPPGSNLQFEVELISWITVVDVCRDGGIVKRILSRGDGGHPNDLDEVTVRYQVKLPDGTIIAEASEGIEFFVDKGHLCPALPKVVKTMERGEKAAVIVQPRYAFEELGSDADNAFHSIPPNTELNIDLELLSFKSVVDVTGDLKVLKKILKAGEGIHRPKEGESVRIKYTGMLEDGTVFERLGFNGEGLFEFVIDEEQVIPGLDRASATMVNGELSLLTVNPEYGYGNREVKRNLAIIPPCSTLVYEVEMVDFTKEKEPWELSCQERIETASKLKECGNDLYKIGKHQRAAKKYEKAIGYVNKDGSFENEEQNIAKSLRVSCWLNCAACSLKLNDFQEAIQFCSKVLDMEFHNVKALYRRAQAYIETYDLDMAELDIRRALEADPQNREVKSIQRVLKHRQGESNKRDAKLYSNMFTRMNKETDMAAKRLKVGNNTVMGRDTEVHGMEMETVSTSSNSSVEAMVVDPSKR